MRAVSQQSGRSLRGEKAVILIENILHSFFATIKTDHCNVSARIASMSPPALERRLCVQGGLIRQRVG